jgi:hypothetical protein
MLAGCTSWQANRVVDSGYSTRTFQILIGQNEQYENEYVQGFVSEPTRDSSPTIAVLWRSMNDLGTDRLVTSTAVGVSQIDGKEFRLPIEGGSGIYALRSDATTAKLPIAPERADDIAAEFRRGLHSGFAAVRKMLEETQALRSLSTFDRVR